MKLNKGDFLWGFVLLLWILILVVPTTRTIFIEVTEAHPYIGGFFKFAILASMGDLLGNRILKKEWIIPNRFMLKAVVWGIIGMMITLVFTVFISGAGAAQAAGRLPFAGSKLAQAFFGSAIMNFTFGPMMYIYHKFGDLIIDVSYEKKGEKITVKDLVDRVDWYTIVSFSWLKTCTCVWIPCHTIVFLLPAEYRVLASAFLSILLGIIIAVSKMASKEAEIAVKTS
jgi:hypothetical protein